MFIYLMCVLENHIQCGQAKNYKMKYTQTNFNMKSVITVDYMHLIVACFWWKDKECTLEGALIQRKVQGV